MAVRGLKRLAIGSGHRQTGRWDCLAPQKVPSVLDIEGWGQRGRPAVAKDVRDLIRRLSRENPRLGAPRIHGERLKLVIDVGETSVGKAWRATASRRRRYE